MSRSQGEVIWSIPGWGNWRRGRACSLHLNFDARLYVIVRVDVEITPEQCRNGASVSVSHRWPLDRPEIFFCTHIPGVFFSKSNQIHFQTYLSGVDFTIRFDTTKSYRKNTLQFEMTSPYTGYITSPGYDEVALCPRNVNAAHTLVIPPGFAAVMLSFKQLYIHLINQPGGFSRCSEYLQLSVKAQNGSMITIWRRCSQEHLTAEVHHTRAIALHFVASHKIGFSLRFSFHQKNSIPQKLASGLFNCSVDHYSSFRQHLDCNLETECEDGRDETGDCPFSSAACQGKVASGSKCLFLVIQQDWFPIESEGRRQTAVSSQLCRARGGEPAVVQTETDLSAVMKMLSMGKVFDKCSTYSLNAVYFDMSVPNMYRLMWTGRDKSVLYTSFADLLGGRSDIDLSLSVRLSFWHGQRLCARIDMTWPKSHIIWPCTEQAVCGVLCNARIFKSDNATQLQNEIFGQSKAEDAEITLRLQSFLNKTPGFVVCPAHHITHMFLLCDLHSDCGQLVFIETCSCCATGEQTKHQMAGGKAEDVEKATSVSMFICDDGVETVHYSLVCDYRLDCQDRSDEAFCRHPLCPQLTCRNGQCVSYITRCDRLSDCLDSSDEDDCHGYSKYPVYNTGVLTTPALIDLDGRGSFTYSNMTDDQDCPDTHYTCPGELSLCLPVYTRCNGYYDCVNRQDEHGCHNVTCPGFYRCRGSSVCVHVDHLCDGWPQCPQRDDEWLCDEQTCPAGCVCQGLAFACTQPFSGHSFPQLRYLDGSGSGTRPENVSSNIYLMYLVLSQCRLKSVPVMELFNLRHLDLSNNLIQEITLSGFLQLPNLRTLSLAGNPLQQLHSAHSGIKQRVLTSIDLSRTQLGVFSSEVLTNFVMLQRLNLSYTTIHTLKSSFGTVGSLLELDLTGSPVKTFPPDVLQGLSSLQRVLSQTYKLCCRQVLPRHLDQQFCLAPQDEISSCDDLLRSEWYRGCLWLMCCLAIIGNAFSLIFRFLVHGKRSKSAFSVFVSSLCLADLCMGVYIAIIGVADSVFHGNYLYRDVSWTNSKACKAAGFLSLLACEVSALMILLITVDRLLVLRFPFSRVRFGRVSATVACLLTWVAGLTLAAVPLLPVTSHWEFYSQTGICIPLPITRHDFQGKKFAFGVMIVFNFTLFVVIAVGQAVIYSSVRANSLTGDVTTRKARDTTIARRLITVAVTDFLCWFPIGLCGLMASAGISISGEVNVAMAIFVLPLNSAFNPFLYTYNLISERQKQLLEEKICRSLRSTLQVDML